MSPGAADFSSFDPARMAEQVAGFWSGLMRPAQPTPPPSPFAAFAQMFGQPQAPQPGFDLFGQAQQAFAQMQAALLPMLDGQQLDAQAVAQFWQKAMGDGAALPAGLMAPFAAGINPGFAAELRGSLDAAPLGLMREHQERFQAFVQAQLDLHAANERFNALLQKVQREGMARFEAKLREHSEPGKQVSSSRALFDLWVDAAEEAFSDAALAPEYRHVYGELVNAQMRLRKCGQDLMEQQLKALGLPSRQELDSSHKRAYEMQRELRALKARVAELEAGAGRAPRAQAAAAAPAPADSAPVADMSAPRRSAKARAKPAAKAAKPASAATRRSTAAKPKARRAAKPLAPLAAVTPKAPQRRGRGK